MKEPNKTVNKPKELRDLAQRLALIEEHEQEIAQQARLIGSLPGLVDWLENQIDACEWDKGFSFSRAQFSSDWNDNLLRFFN